MPADLSKQSLTQTVKKLALETGFDEAGITVPASLAEAEAKLRAWVAEGRHAGMKYLEDFPARRARFFGDFPGARSVLVLGVSYYSPAKEVEGFSSPGDILKGRVARYAWGLDYHEEIRKRHGRLIARLAALCGPEFRAGSCVDIQPIPERYAAFKAGFGFIGKHTGLLSRKFGPWLFLSEIITNLELEEDLPAAGDCGTCVECQSACPTGALDRDYSLDARLCIAYWTIEHKGVIPRDFRPKIKDWIFGCDICMAVCPFGTRPVETSWLELKPESGFGPKLDPAELFGIKTQREYEKKFQGTALLRAKRKQMLRNACIVLGNSGHANALPYLAQGLGDPETLVRLHAAWGLGRIPCAKSVELLKARAAEEKDSGVSEEIAAALEALEHLAKPL